MFYTTRHGRYISPSLQCVSILCAEDAERERGIRGSGQTFSCLMWKVKLRANRNKSGMRSRQATGPLFREWQGVPKKKSLAITVSIAQDFVCSRLPPQVQTRGASDVLTAAANNRGHHVPPYDAFADHKWDSKDAYFEHSAREQEYLQVC